MPNFSFSTVSATHTTPSRKVRVLVVEDHQDLCEATMTILAEMGCEAQGVARGQEVKSLLYSFAPDLIVLDLNLPDGDGLSVARDARLICPDIGIVMVTGRSDLREKLAGFDSGADAYLVKPVAPEELSAAIKALSRRLASLEEKQSDYVLTEDGWVLEGNGLRVELTHREYLLLKALGSAPRGRLPFWLLSEIPMEFKQVISRGALEVLVVRLRKKFEDAGVDSPVIKAIRGFGYQLCLKIQIQ